MRQERRVELRLPRPHAKQKAFLDSDAKRLVIVAGRRGGKTTGAGLKAIRGALEHKRNVLYVAPRSDQTSAFWRFIGRSLQPLVDEGLAKKQSTIRCFDLWNGGRIRCKTGFNADALRGEFADLLILDEYSIMQPDVWGEVGAPMLMDNYGDAVFIFTPKQRNHAWLLYQRAMRDVKGVWQAWHFTSIDNPHLSPEALALVAEDLDEEGYRQEILAEFLEGQGTIFRNVDELCVLQPLQGAEKGTYVAGIDWALSNDFTAISIVDVGTRRQVYLDRWNGINYVAQVERIDAILRRFNVTSVLSEANAMGKPNNERLQALGHDVQDFWTTSQTKGSLIRNLSVNMEDRSIMLLDNHVLAGELVSMESKPNSRGVSYAAPQQLHDDTVIATALSFWAVTRSNRTITQAYGMGGGTWNQ